MKCSTYHIGLVGSLACAAVASAQPPALPLRWTNDFVIRLGDDTLVVERVTRNDTRLASDLMNRQQRVRIGVIMTTQPDGLVSHLESTVRHAADAPAADPLQVATATFTSDTVLLATSAGAASSKRLPVPPGTLPFINLSAASLEQIFVRARALGRGPITIPVFAMVGGQVRTMTVQWIGADSAVLLIGTEVRAQVSPAGELLGAIIPAQGVRFSRTGASDNTAPRAADRPDYSAPKGAPFTAEDVQLRNVKAGIVLAGTLTMPRHAPGTRVPAVVMITGSGAEDRDEATPALPGWKPFRQIADTLGRRGIAVLRLDDRGVGGSDRGSPDATSADFADDIRAGLQYLRTRPDVDPSKLGLIGHSEGGMIAPMIAATDRRLHGIVLIAGPSHTGRAISDAQVRDAIAAQGVRGGALDSAIARNAVARDALLAKTPWLKFWFDYDPLPTAKRVHVPVLIVQGATDQQVSPDQALELAQALHSGGNRSVSVKMIPATNHLLVYDVDGSPSNYKKLPSLSVNPALLGAVADWLAKWAH